MPVAGILLAAGASSRMRGRDKLLENIGNTPILADRAQMLLASALASLVVVLRPQSRERRQALEGLDLHLIKNPNAETGMASSIEIGLKAVPVDCDAAIMMPADMPNITTPHINLMLTHHAENPDKILRAKGKNDNPASPTLIPRKYFKQFENLTGDEGGRSLFRTQLLEFDTVILSGENPTLDLDTPEDWENWRANK